MSKKIIGYIVFAIFSLCLFFELLTNYKKEDKIFISIWFLIAGVLSLQSAIKNKSKSFSDGLTFTNKIRGYLAGVTSIIIAIVTLIDYLRKS